MPRHALGVACTWCLDLGCVDLDHEGPGTPCPWCRRDGYEAHLLHLAARQLASILAEQTDQEHTT